MNELKETIKNLREEMTKKEKESDNVDKPSEDEFKKIGR